MDELTIDTKEMKFSPQLKAISVKDLGEGEIEAIVATENVDRVNEILVMSGLDTKNYMKNPVVQWGHDYSQPPIAKTISLKKVGDQLVARMKFAIEVYDFARLVYNLIQGGYINAFSIGFIPKEMEDGKNGQLIWTKSEMLEYSVVPIPANSQALLTAKKFGIDVDYYNKVATGEIKIEKKEIEATETGELEDIEVKQGKVLSKKNRNILEAARAALDEVLSADGKEDADEGKDETKGAEDEEIQSNIDLIKKSASALEANASAATEPGANKVKYLIKLKKIAQISDRSTELLINQVKEKIAKEQNGK